MAVLVSTDDLNTANSSPDRRTAIVTSVLGVVALYSFAGWAYIAGNAMAHPQSLAWPLTHFSPWPHEDTFGALCFGCSLTAAVGRAVVKHGGKH
jgi:hypothetical protein